MRKNVRRCVTALAVIVAPMLCPADLAFPAHDLARVEVIGPVLSFPLPVHEHFRDQSGTEYFLVFADSANLSRVNWPYRVLIPDARPDQFILATRMGGADPRIPIESFQVVHDDGVRLLVRGGNAELEALASRGLGVRRLADQPIVWRQALEAPLDVPVGRPVGMATSDALLREIVARCDTNHLYGLMTRLTGEEAAVMGGDLYAIATRHTASGTSINRATAFVSEHLSALGMEVPTSIGARAAIPAPT